VLIQVDMKIYSGEALRQLTIDRAGQRAGSVSGQGSFSRDYSPTLHNSPQLPYKIIQVFFFLSCFFLMEVREGQYQPPPKTSVHAPKLNALFNELARKGVLAAITGLAQPNQSELMEQVRKRKEEEKALADEIEEYKKVNSGILKYFFSLIDAGGIKSQEEV
jgi:hypothetical protein